MNSLTDITSRTLLFDFRFFCKPAFRYLSGITAVLLLTVTPSWAQITFVDLGSPGVATAVDGSHQVGNLGNLAAMWSGSPGSAINLSPDGDTFSRATGVSGGQQGGYVTFSGVQNAALWSGSRESFLNLNPAGATRSEIDGMFGSQQVGTASFDGLGPGSSQTHAALWSGTAASFVDLHPSSVEKSIALGNSDSQQVGRVSIGGNYQAAMWSGTKESYLNLHPLGASSSLAGSISGSQQGGWAIFNNQQHAAIWSGGPGSFVDLNPLGFAQSSVSSMSGPYQGGYVANGTVSGAFGFQAGFWSGTADSFVNLQSSLSPSFTSSTLWGLSLQGDTLYAVGNAYDIGGASHAMLWIVPVPEPQATGATFGSLLLIFIMVWKYRQPLKSCLVR